ncbi:hypothetical protein K438DRAFT_1789639 [Mycena galopus ATCC 62051]|nr:hypothetical protein K438DRAFT_1789639 [Mycena galopus ATCC 62051]
MNRTGRVLPWPHPRNAKRPRARSLTLSPPPRLHVIPPPPPSQSAPPAKTCDEGAITVLLPCCACTPPNKHSSQRNAKQVFSPEVIEWRKKDKSTRIVAHDQPTIEEFWLVGGRGGWGLRWAFSISMGEGLEGQGRSLLLVPCAIDNPTLDASARFDGHGAHYARGIGAPIPADRYTLDATNVEGAARWTERAPLRQIEVERAIAQSPSVPPRLCAISAAEDRPD